MLLDGVHPNSPFCVSSCLASSLDAAPARSRRRLFTQAPFPKSLYDADRFDDFTALLNLEMLDTSLNQLAVDLKTKRP